MTEVIGWLSSLILLATIAKQIYKQWKTRTSEGVSKWLFLGQISASIGFTIYSVLLHNRIFIVTNSLMLVSSFVGVAITLHQQRRATP